MLELFLSISESLGCARGHVRCAHSCSPFAHRSTGTNGESGMQLPRGTKTMGWTEGVRDSSCLKQDVENVPLQSLGQGNSCCYCWS